MRCRSRADSLDFQSWLFPSPLFHPGSVSLTRFSFRFHPQIMQPESWHGDPKRPRDLDLGASGDQQTIHFVDVFACRNMCRAAAASLWRLKFAEQITKIMIHRNKSKLTRDSKIPD